MLFGGTIIISTLIEWLVLRSRNPSVLRFWFITVPAIDTTVVLPAVTGSILSGVAQAVIDYESFRSAPKYVIGTLHALTTFALWWALTDRTTQKEAKRAVLKWTEESSSDNNSTTVEIPPVLYTRRRSNVVSCIFVVALYAIMVLKPGQTLKHQ